MPSVVRRALPGSPWSRARAVARLAGLGLLAPGLIAPALIAPGLLAASPAPAAAQPSGPNVPPLPPVANKLPRATPESQGVSSQALLAFIEALDANVDTMNSVIVVRRGQVIAEGWWAPFAADTPHQMFSLTKSFTSTAIGIAQAEGKLSVDDPVLKFFPEVTPAAGNDFLKAMRIRDLLAMSTGHRTEPSFAGSTTWTKTFFDHPVLHKPGTIFLYNTPASYMLSAIVQKATGQKQAEYLQSRLLTPLGIGTPRWETSPEGITIGGTGLWLRTEDIARFGQLYLQKGQWQGRQLVPAEYVAAATTRQTSNGSSPTSDWDQGYGYHFWRSRHRTYRGDGAHGQFCMVLPEQETVVAMTSGTRNMQGVMNVVWEKLLPALGAGAAKLPENLAAQQALRDRVAKLTVRPQSGTLSPASGAVIFDKPYLVGANDQGLEALTIVRGEGGQNTLKLKVKGKEHGIGLKQGEWQKGTLAWANLVEQPAAASGAWTTVDTYVARVAFYETPFILTLTLKFNGDTVQIDREMNVGGGPKPAVVTGKIG
jgi:CubicO group peptidase (beta-lactamase class C family)